MNRNAPWNQFPFMRHAIIHLPPLRGEQAHDAICFLETVTKPIWHAHGDAIADYRAMMDIETPQPPDSRGQWPADAGDNTF